MSTPKTTKHTLYPDQLWSEQWSAMRKLMSNFDHHDDEGNDGEDSDLVKKFPKGLEPGTAKYAYTYNLPLTEHDMLPRRVGTRSLEYERRRIWRLKDMQRRTRRLPDSAIVELVAIDKAWHPMYVTDVGSEEAVKAWIARAYGKTSWENFLKSYDRKPGKGDKIGRTFVEGQSKIFLNPTCLEGRDFMSSKINKVLALFKGMTTQRRMPFIHQLYPGIYFYFNMELQAAVDYVNSEPASKEDLIKIWLGTISRVLRTRTDAMAIELNELQHKIGALQARYGRDLFAVETLENRSDQYVNEMIEKILQHPQVERVDFRKRKMMIYTKALNTATPLGRSHEPWNGAYIGKFELGIDVVTGSIGCRQLAAPKDAPSQHPFLSTAEHTWVCLGSYAGHFGYSMQQFDYLRLVTNLIEFLQASDTRWRPTEWWPQLKSMSFLRGENKDEKIGKRIPRETPAETKEFPYPIPLFGVNFKRKYELSTEKSEGENETDDDDDDDDDDVADDENDGMDQED